MIDYIKILLGIFCLIIAYLYTIVQKYTASTPVPFFNVNEYFGAGKFRDYVEDEKVYDFKIEFNEVEKLKRRIADYDSFTSPLEGVAFEYGFNTNKLKEIKDYWSNEYLNKWTQRQNYMNSLPQFTTQIQGLKIHFVHVKPQVDKNVKVLPILLLHGWPTSPLDYYEMIEMLKKENDGIAFEIVAPSLPGFGFSEGAKKKGLGSEKMAVIIRNLMLRLKIDKFYVHGGDWGGITGSQLTAIFQENVLGFHSNFMNIGTPLSAFKLAVATFFPSLFIEDQKYIGWQFNKTFNFLVQESGYFHLQSTKPDTIGIALSQNPIGLAAYILEKFSTATNRNYRHDPTGGLLNHFTLETLLDNIMIYYITNSITTSARIYKEAFNPDKLNVDRVAINVPAAAAYFKNEIYHQLPFLIKEKYKNLIQVNYYENGGHFIPLEQPKVLYEDIVSFVKKTLA